MEKIILSQLNVKKVEFKKSKDAMSIELDTKMDEELEAEGFAREVARNVQAQRKKVGLQKGDLIHLKIYSDEVVKSYLEKHREFLMERTNSNKIEIEIENIDDKENVFTVKERKIYVEFS